MPFLKTCTHPVRTLSYEQCKTKRFGTLYSSPVDI